MPKKKGTRNIQEEDVQSSRAPNGESVPASTKSGSTEDPFSNLKEKISRQLKSIDQNPRSRHRTPKETQDSQLFAARGRKRDANGTIITADNQPHAKLSAEVEGDTVGYDYEQELKAALQELGGTNEDLDLIADAASESELEGFGEDAVVKQVPRKKNSSLQDGIANILKEIELVRGDRLELSDGPGEEDVGNSHDDAKGFAAKGNAQAQRALSDIVTDDRPTEKKVVDRRFRCQPRADWFNLCPSNTESHDDMRPVPSQQVLEQLHLRAKELLNEENEAFKNAQQSSSSQAFYNTIIASGTLSDKISALTLAVQESPLHNVKALENLIALARKRSRAQAVDVLKALKDLFAQGSLLPSDRRLYTFATQPTLLAAASNLKSWSLGDRLPRILEEQKLICWAFEDWLKQQYFEILKILEVWCNDEIEYSRGRAVSYVFELLKEKPEQESNLLRLLINKLGDPVKKIASQTSYLLMQLLMTHPAMKIVVVSAIEADFIFRPGQSMHGIYYAAVTLNQTALSMREEEVAKKLLDIYFGLFTTLLKSYNQSDDAQNKQESQSRAKRQRKKKNENKSDLAGNAQSEELREKLISAVLTGVNRAYPYVGTGQTEFAGHLETLFKITHSANFSTGVQAMLLIQHLTITHSIATDRFYRTLYESLLDTRLISTSKQQLYLNLLHRSLKADTNINRLKAFVKRLLQVLSLHEPSFICGVFFLLKSLEQTYPSLSALINQPEDHENEEEVFRDVDDDSNDNDDVRMSDVQQTNGERKDRYYDGYKRAPEHANADNSCAWEVLPFVSHFHPSVTVSADHYIQGTKLPGKPDLNLHTLIHFLDRFVYRNPKLAGNNLRGSSIMQPMANDDQHAVLISSASHKAQLSVNTDEFKNKKSEDVAAEDVFFHRYFATLGKDSKSKQQKGAKKDEDDDVSVGNEDEDAVWKAMIESAPDLEGEGSEDEISDLDMSDFENEMDDLDDLSGAEKASLSDGSENEVDIEPGIFDDSDDSLSRMDPVVPDDVQDTESDFEGLDDAKKKETPRAAKIKEQRKAEKDKRKKLKALPTFASAADYAQMLDDDNDEDLG